MAKKDKKETNDDSEFFALKYNDEIVIWTLRSTMKELVENIMDTGEVFLNRPGSSLNLDQLARAFMEGNAEIVKAAIYEID